MWNHFCKKLNGNTAVEKSESIYCGDAAGRPATATRKKDFSADDRNFAQNVDLTFHTPESFFLGEPLELPKP